MQQNNLTTKEFYSKLMNYIYECSNCIKNGTE